MNSRQRSIVTLVCAACLGSGGGPALCQDAVEVQVGATPVIVQPAAAAATPAPAVEGQPAPGTPPGSPVPAPGEPSAAKPAADASAPASAPGGVKRSAEPPEKPDPKELDVRLGEDGLVQFTFRNQSWPAILDWLSEISSQPLDWQELPGDFVNLSAPRKLTLEETTDLINRHLLSRGFTLLKLEGGLAVVKLEQLNPSLVPQVAPEQLAQLPPHSFVRTSFALSWLKAPAMAEELKPMLSATGKLHPLSATNRLEALDTVANLRQIHELLRNEESSDARRELVREFMIKHLRASMVKLQLEAFLGLGAPQAIDQMDMTQLQMAQMEIQMRMQTQQQQQGGGQPAAGGAPGKGPVSIVVDDRRNALIVHGPRDQLAIVEEFIERIDVPGELASLSELQTKIQVFRLASLDPNKLVEMLRSMNALEPGTQLQVDADNRALIAYGSVADRYIIHQVIERLDGSGRQFEVLQLRRLDAEDVAKSIEFLMGAGEKKKDNSRRSYYFWDPFGANEDKKDDDQFRVSANTRFNQVLLWANDLEMQEVRKLLMKLGELPPEGGRRERVRWIEAAPTDATRRYLEQLRDQWERISPHPLVLPSADQFEPPVGEEAAPGPKAPKSSAPEQAPAESKSSEAVSRGLSPLPFGASSAALVGFSPDEGAERLPSTEMKETDPPGRSPGQRAPEVSSAAEFDRMVEQNRSSSPVAKDGPAKPAPIRIEFDPQGNLLLSGGDPSALDELEELMLQMRPPKRSYAVFRLRYASPTWVVLNLEDFFKDSEAKDDRADRFFRFYFDIDEEENKDRDAGGLGKKKKLRFVADSDTNSIVVTNADREDLQTIGELIELWDVPEPADEKTSRYTDIVRVKHSNAADIVATIKDAYRDLLSSNDRAFEGNGGGQDGGGDSQRQQGGGGQSLVNADRSRDSGRASFRFKGKLSLGVNERTNSIVVSAEGQPLLELIKDMIEQLDSAAKPQSNVEVIQLSGGLNGKSVEAALRAALGQAAGDRSRTEQGRQPAANTPNNAVGSAESAGGPGAVQGAAVNGTPGG